MLNTIKNFPNQFQISLNKGEKVLLDKKYDKIIVCGMGGSTLPADIVQSYLQNQFNVYVNRDYFIPDFADEKTLNIISSFSGNTEETIFCLKDSLKKRLDFIVLSNNGKLKNIALQNNYPFIQLPDSPQPRLATGHIFASIIGLLQANNLIENKNVEIEKLIQHLNDNIKSLEEQAFVLAKQLENKVPIIYSGLKFWAAARIFKINFNENTKIQSFHNVFPELNHNEMVGFTKLLFEPGFIFLKSKFDYERNELRINKMKELFEDKKLFVHEFEMKGDNYLEQAFYTIVMAYFTSYYLALEYKIDPMPVDMVEEFKKKLIK